MLSLRPALRTFPVRFVFVASTRVYSAVWFPSRAAYSFPAAPILCFHCFITSFVRARIALPCAFLPIEPVRSPAISLFFAFPRFTSAPRVRVHSYSTLHLRSLALPLSHDAHQLVTSTCRVQCGCSGHPHTPIPHPHPLLSRTVDDLTPSHYDLASF